MTPLMRRWLLVVVVLATAVLFSCAVKTWSTYVESYGAEAPYYGRTTNMDKWESPIVSMVIWDASGLALVAALAYGFARLRRVPNRVSAV